MNHFDEDWLYEQYIELDRTKGEIAKQCGVSERTIKVRLKKLGLKKDVWKNRKRYFAQKKDKNK